MQANWDIGQLLQNSFEIFKQNMSLFISVQVIIFVISTLFSLPSTFAEVMAQFLGEFMELDNNIILIISILINVVSSLVSLVVSTYLGLGSCQVFLKVLCSQPASFSDLLVSFDLFAKGLGAILITTCAYLLGFMLCLIPGIIVTVGLVFSLPLIVDRNLGPIEAIKTSWATTNGVKLQVFLVLLIASLMCLAGMTACCVGYFVAVPIAGLMFISIYEKLSAQLSAS